MKNLSDEKEFNGPMSKADQVKANGWPEYRLGDTWTLREIPSRKRQGTNIINSATTQDLGRKIL